jgi:hypothetical protein
VFILNNIFILGQPWIKYFQTNYYHRAYFVWLIQIPFGNTEEDIANAAMFISYAGIIYDGLVPVLCWYLYKYPFVCEHFILYSLSKF